MNVIELGAHPLPEGYRYNIERRRLPDIGLDRIFVELHKRDVKFKWFPSEYSVIASRWIDNSPTISESDIIKMCNNVYRLAFPPPTNIDHLIGTHK